MTGNFYFSTRHQDTVNVDGLSHESVSSCIDRVPDDFGVNKSDLKLFPDFIGVS